jgi:hypothetical protein
MMSDCLSTDETLSIETTVVTLRGGQPVLNGRPLEGWTCKVLRSDKESIELEYTSRLLGRGRFGFQANQSDSRMSIRYWVEALPRAIGGGDQKLSHLCRYDRGVMTTSDDIAELRLIA